MEVVKNIRKVERTKKLNPAEMKEYRRFTDNLSQLGQGACPELNYTLLMMSKKINLATVAYLQKVNKVMKMVKSNVYYGRVG